MFRKLRLSALLVFTILPSTSAQTNYSFEDFGYPAETVSWGSNVASTYFIPIDEEPFLDKGGMLYLNFQTSQVLNTKQSYITIALNDLPLKTKSLNQTNTVSFRLPITKSNISNGFLKIDVYIDLLLKEKLCESFDEGAFWTRRLASSRILLNAAPKTNIKTQDISRFISEVEHLYIPKAPSLNTIKYSAYLKFLLKNEFDKDIKLYTLPKILDSIKKKSIVLGPLDSLNANLQNELLLDGLSQDTGVVKLIDVESLRPKLAAQSFLALLVSGVGQEGFKKAAESLLSKGVAKSAFSSSYTVKKSWDIHTMKNKAVSKISFKDLGAEEIKLEGFRNLQQTILLPSSIFKEGLSEFTINLKVIYRPLVETEKVFANIYVDNLLKASYLLDDTGRLNEKLVINNFEFKQVNSLRFEYDYKPEGGECTVKPAVFYAQTDLDASFVEATAFNKFDELNFGNFNKNIFENKAIIYWDVPHHIQNIASLAKLVEAHNSNIKFNRDYVYPEIYPIDSLETNIETNNGIIITSREEFQKHIATSNFFIDIKNDQYQFKKEDFSKFLKLNYADFIGVNQLFSEGENDFMFVYNPEGHPDVLKQLIDNTQHSSLTNGENLILANKTKAYSFSLETKDLLSEQEVQTIFDVFWENYRIIIIFGLLILLVVLLVLLFLKSQESKNDIIDNK